MEAAIRSEALASVILVLGAPRSGTTWLAKIIDSHPDVLYRHEPDQTLPNPVPLSSKGLMPLLERWAADISPRTAAKQPIFAKSWQPPWATPARWLLAMGVSALDRLPPRLRRLADPRIPDFARKPAPRVAISRSHGPRARPWCRGPCRTAGRC